MSTRTVARKDFRSVSRSRGLWIAATLLAVLASLFAYVYEGYGLSPTESVTRLFDTLALALGVFLPLVALVVSYMAIAGERESGGIKFLLGMPNTRREVFLGKLASRVVLVWAGLGLSFAAATSVAVAKHGVLPPGPVFGLFAVSLAYAAVFVAVAVALSGAVAERSRAIAAAVGSYVVLVILFVVPGLRLSAVVRELHHGLLGLERNPDLYDAISYVSPYVAFQKAGNLVFPPSVRSRVFVRPGASSPDLPFYLDDWVAVVVFAGWLVVPLVVGYLRFDRADLD